MTTIKPFKKANLHLNNTIDCDVIQDALQQAENATTDKETLDAISYLITAVAYRGGSTTLIENYKAEYLTA